MRIGFVVADYPEVSETFISRKVEYLQAQGHEVVVFRVGVRPGSPPQGCCGTRLHLVDMPTPRRRWGRVLRVAVEMMRSLASPVRAAGVLRRVSARGISAASLNRLANYLCVARWRLDVLHVHFGSNLVPLFGIGNALRIPVVVSLLSMEEFRNIDLNQIAAEADRLIASSHFVVREFRKYVPGERPIEVLAPELPCDAFRCERSYSPRERYRIVTVARLHWKKGLLYALHAVRELKMKNIPFIYEIVGEGEDRVRLLHAIADLGLEDCVVLHGRKQPREIPAFLSTADVFVLPTLQETFGLALVEAQAAGLPVVANRVGGIPEAVHELETAILVPVRDYVSLFRAILGLLENAEQRRQMGSKGREFAKRFDTKLIGDRLLAIYEEALAERRPPFYRTARATRGAGLTHAAAAGSGGRQK